MPHWTELSPWRRVALFVAGTAWIPLVNSDGDTGLITLWLVVWLVATVAAFWPGRRG